MKKKFFILTTVSMSLNFFKNQINALQQDFEVTLISSPSIQLQEIAKREGVKAKAIEIKREIAFIKDIFSLTKLIIMFLKERPFIIHCNTPKASLLGLIAGYLTRVPKRIYYIHGFRFEGAKGLVRKILITMEKIACFCATDIIAVSNGVKQTAMKDLTNKEISILHHGSANGMIISEFENSNYDIEEVKTSLKISKDDFIFGFVGRIVGDKGINELINAFNDISKKYKNCKLILVGRYEDQLDPLKKSTKKIIKENVNIIEIGFKSDVKKYLSIINIFVSPSYREGFGLSLIEANLMGKPVIATNITGYSEIILEGKNGFLINSHSQNELLKKMEFAYKNPDILFKMKNDCVNSVKNRYDHNDVLKNALKYYKSLLN